MKSIKKFTISSIILYYLVIINVAYTQFIPKNNGINGGSIRCFAISPGKIYAGTEYGGIYFSSNAGINWVNLNNDIQNYYIEDIAIKGNAIYVGCAQHPTDGNGGFYYNSFMFRSTNDGNNWVAIQSGFGFNWISVFSLFTYGDLIFAGTDNGIYKANDSININWRKVGSMNTAIFSFINNGNILFAGAYNGVYRSFNSGDDWELINSGLGNTEISSLCVKNNKVFAGTNNGIYVTSNNGDNWFAVNNGLTNTVISSLYSYNYALLTGTYEGIFISTDDGLNWNLANNGMPLTFFDAICFDGNNLFAGASYYYPGVYKSTNRGQNWFKSDYGIHAPNIWEVMAIGNNLFATSDGQGIFKSTNWGETWEDLSNGINSPYVRQLAVKGNNIFVENLNELFVSTNYGINWEHSSGGLNNVRYITELYIDRNDYYLGSFYTGFYKSNNNGNNWALFGLENADIRAILRVSNNIFVGTSTEGMFLSSNEGINWVEINNGLPPTYYTHARALINIGNNIFLGNVFRGGIYMTTNNGDNWVKRNSGIYDSVVFSFTIKDSILFASDYKEGLFTTNNLGQNWIFKGIELYQKDVRSLCIAGGYIFAGCNGFGIWRRPLSEVISIKKISSKIPDKNRLYQNYPNPFNPNTKINFSITKNENVSIKVYDMMGREVITLVNQQMKPGKYTTDWTSINGNGQKVASGVYFYRLVTPSYTEVKKMVLVK